MARPPNLEASQRLLDAARAAFAEVGVDAARVQDIAKAAGFSKAAFYLYFESKEAVFEQLVLQLFDALTEVTNARHGAFHELIGRVGCCQASDWAEGSDRLRAFAALDREYTVIALRAMWAQRDLIACVLEQTTGPRRNLVDQFVDVMRSTLSTRLREAMDAGFLRQDLDGDLVSELIVGMYVQLARRMIRLAEPPDFASWARDVDTFVAEGIGARPPVVEKA